ncbi:MAG: hypothetical protein QOG03_279 [Actinomycetota bacterium]|nr:hypothetical protein [Actinomycetota bacterium]
MPRDKDFKKLVRQRMHDTGERYTDARAAIDPDHTDAKPGQSRASHPDGAVFELTGYTMGDRLSPNSAGPVFRVLRRFLDPLADRMLTPALPTPGSVGFPLPKIWRLVVTSTDLIFSTRASWGDSDASVEVGRVRRDRITHITRMDQTGRSAFRRRVFSFPYVLLGVDGDDPVVLTLMGSAPTAAELAANTDRLVEELR